MKNKQKRFLIIILGLVVIAIILLCLASCNSLNKEAVTQNNQLTISQNQTQAKDPNLLSHNKEEYFELQGFGLLEIDINNPYLNLKNPEGNDVYFSYEVLYGDNVLCKTELIEPGNMVQFDIYRCLDAGEHTLTYSINVYDKTTMDVLWSGIKQEQDILIKN